MFMIVLLVFLSAYLLFLKIIFMIVVKVFNTVHLIIILMVKPNKTKGIMDR